MTTNQTQNRIETVGFGKWTYHESENGVTIYRHKGIRIYSYDFDNLCWIIKGRFGHVLSAAPATSLSQAMKESYAQYERLKGSVTS